MDNDYSFPNNTNSIDMAGRTSSDGSDQRFLFYERKRPVKKKPKPPKAVNVHISDEARRHNQASSEKQVCSDHEKRDNKDNDIE